MSQLIFGKTSIISLSNFISSAKFLFHQQQNVWHYVRYYHKIKKCCEHVRLYQIIILCWWCSIINHRIDRTKLNNSEDLCFERCKKYIRSYLGWTFRCEHDLFWSLFPLNKKDVYCEGYDCDTLTNTQTCKSAKQH